MIGEPAGASPFLGTITRADSPTRGLGVDVFVGASDKWAIMRISCGQVQGTSDVDRNKAGVAALVERAAAEGSDLVVFPEMSILEFFPRIPHRYEYFELAEPLPGPTFDWFSQLAALHGIYVLYNFYEHSPEHLYFDTSVLLDREGNMVGRQRMMHLAEEPGYNEKFYYAPGQDAYNVFDLDGWRMGVAICYDRHFPEVFRSMILQGAEVVLVPTAVAASEPFAEVYELEMRAAAVTHGVYVALANRAGVEDPLAFLGRSMLIDPTGKVIVSADGEPDRLASAELSKAVIAKARVMFPFLRDRRPDTYAVPGWIT